MVVDKYTRWMIARALRKTIAYLLIFPILAVFYPFSTIGNGLGLIFYKLRDRR